MATLKKPQIGFQDQLSLNEGLRVLQNAPRGAFCFTFDFIKLPFVIKIFVLSIFKWLFYTGFTVLIMVNFQPHVHQR